MLKKNKKLDMIQEIWIENERELSMYWSESYLAIF